MKANMLEYLEETTARLPDKIAFYDDRDSLTFAALEKTAQRIGNCLAETTLARGPVALLLDARSIRNIPALYGVLYAGRAYAAGYRHACRTFASAAGAAGPCRDPGG